MHTRNCLRKRKETKSERRRRSGKKKKKKKRQEGHGQVMEEIFAVAQKEGERAARGAYTGICLRKRKGTKSERRRRRREEEEEEEKRQEENTGKCRRKYRDGTEGKRKSGKRCT